MSGTETLVYLGPSGEVPLSGSGDEPFCGGKVYCDFPPSTSLSRILRFDFLSSTQAIFLESAHDDFGDTWIYTADLESGEHTLLSGEVSFPEGSWQEFGGRPDWVYSFARVDSTVHFTLVTTDGLELFTSEDGSALVSIHTLAVPPGEHVIDSELDVSSDAVAVWAEYSDSTSKCWLLDRAGALLHPEVDSCEAVSIAAGRIVIEAYAPHRLEIYDTPSGTARILALAEDVFTFPEDIDLSPSGDRFYTVGGEGGLEEICVYDLVAAKLLGCTPGTYALFSPTDSTKLIVQNSAAYSLELVDIEAAAVTTLIDGSALSLGYFAYNDFPGQRFSPDGRWLVTTTGAPSLELFDNIGLTLIDMQTLATQQIKPPAISEMFMRRVEFSPDGRSLVFLDDKNHLDDGLPLDLDVVEVDLEHLSPPPVPMAATTEQERAFVLGFAP